MPSVQIQEARVVPIVGGPEPQVRLKQANRFSDHAALLVDQRESCSCLDLLSRVTMSKHGEPAPHVILTRTAYRVASLPHDLARSAITAICIAR